MLFSLQRGFATGVLASAMALRALADEPVKNASEAGATAATSEVTAVKGGEEAPLELLDSAFKAMLEHQGRWAYTDTRNGVGYNGKAMGETVVRVDPSKPYAEQRVTTKIGGKDPSEKQLKRMRENAEKFAKAKEKQQMAIKAPPVVDESKLPKPPEKTAAEKYRLNLNGQRVAPDFAHASVVKEDEKSITYLVPLRVDGKGDINLREVFDKFELTARVNKERKQFENASFRQTAAMRVKLIAKVADTQLDIEFTQPDPKYPSLSFPTKMTAKGEIALLFGSYHDVSSETVRTDVKHVTPYDERFGVKIGEMKTIEF